jgi:hypothetical protein
VTVTRASTPRNRTRGEVVAQEEVKNAAEEEDERRQQMDGCVVLEGDDRQNGDVDRRDDRENLGGEKPDRRRPLDCRMRLWTKKMSKRRTASGFIVTAKIPGSSHRRPQVNSRH